MTIKLAMVATGVAVGFGLIGVTPAQAAFMYSHLNSTGYSAKGSYLAAHLKTKI